MRNLTIIRAKRFVACLGRMKVYLEDPESRELTINDVPCRKLGTLKNGETKSFYIPEEETRVFVIADRLSKNYCNDYLVIPAGRENVILSGKNSFDPVSGSAFHFDAQPDGERILHWTRCRNIGAAVLIAAMLIAMLPSMIMLGLSLVALPSTGRPNIELPDYDSPKMFGRGNFYITLTDDFRQKQAPYFAEYESTAVTVSVYKWPKVGNDIAGYESLEAFSQMTQELNGHDAPLRQEENFWYYCTYQDDPGETLHGYFMMYEAEKDFYIVQFSLASGVHYTKCHSKIMQWADSVIVN